MLEGKEDETERLRFEWMKQGRGSRKENRESKQEDFEHRKTLTDKDRTRPLEDCERYELKLSRPFKDKEEGESEEAGEKGRKKQEKGKRNRE